jgi:hypothetical protein
MEMLIKSTMEAMKEMMTLMKSNTNNQNQNNGNRNNQNAKSDEEKKKIREEKQQKFKDAPVCKHCGKKHPSKKEEECWELKANAASRPTNWKPIKNT